jgi:RNA polymerase sigma factor (TIGR02999 family)
MNNITKVLSAMEQGDPNASEQLLPLVYDELRKLAAVRLAQEKPGQTLQPTALVHEAYLRLVGNHTSQQWNSRGHFFGAAAEAMRRILVELARRKAGPQQGGNWTRVQLADNLLASDQQPEEILLIDHALDALAQESPEKAELVKLRFFAGLSHQEAAEALGISRATADRYWAYAKAYLFAALQDQEKSQIA